MLTSASVPVMGAKNNFVDREEKDGVGDGIVTTNTQWQMLNSAAASTAAQSLSQPTSSSSSQPQQNSNHHQHDNSGANSLNRQWDEKESKSHSTTVVEAWEEQKDEGKDDKDKSKPWIDDGYQLSPSKGATTATITTMTTTTTATMTGINGVSPVGIADAKLSCDNLSVHNTTTSPPPHATSIHKKPTTPPPPFIATIPQVNPHSLPVPGEHTNGERSWAGAGAGRDVDHEAQAKSPFQTIEHYDPSNPKSGKHISSIYHNHYNTIP